MEGGEKEIKGEEEEDEEKGDRSNPVQIAELSCSLDARAGAKLDRVDF